MPWTIPIVIVAGLAVGRLVVEFGGDALKTVFGAIKNFFTNFLGLGKEMTEPMAEQFRDGDNQNRDSRERGNKEKTPEKENANPSHEQDKNQTKKEQDKEQPKKEKDRETEKTPKKEKEPTPKITEDKSKQPKATKSEEEFNPKETQISNNIKKFVPANWMNLSVDEKKQAAQALFDEVAKSEGLQIKYQIDFASTNNDVGITNVVDTNNRTITFDLKHLKDGSQTAIPLYNALIKEASYARQNEIMEGLIAKPSKFERDCMPAIASNKLEMSTKLYVQSTPFLNDYVNKISSKNAVSYITAKPTDSFERRAVAALQPSERFATMLNTEYFGSLEKAINEVNAPLSDTVKEQVEDNHKMAYHNVVSQLKELYNVKGSIEREIENALAKSDPENQTMKDTKEQKHNVNWQVLYAVGVYRMQSTKELVGEEFEDPRRDVVLNIISNGGEIASMREDYYERNKGRIEFENIKVVEITPKDQEQKKNPPTQEKENSTPQPKSPERIDAKTPTETEETETEKIDTIPTDDETSVREEGEEEEENLFNFNDNSTYTEDLEPDEFDDLDPSDFI